MPLTLIGYFPKKVQPVPEALAGIGVAEICSVSECLAPGPPGWIDHWIHNDWGFFDSVAAARSVIPPGSPEYRLLAFSILDRRFAGGTSTQIPIDAPGIEQLPAGLVPLGFDIVSRSTSDFFECSPLSCNGTALEIPVNRHCLVDDLAEAERIALRFSVQQPEPGDYFVLQIHRLEDRSRT